MFPSQMKSTNKKKYILLGYDTSLVYHCARSCRSKTAINQYWFCSFFQTMELEMLRFTVDALFGLVSGSKITWLGLGEDLG